MVLQKDDKGAEDRHQGYEYCSIEIYVHGHLLSDIEASRTLKINGDVKTAAYISKWDPQKVAARGGTHRWLLETTFLQNYTKKGKSVAKSH